MGVASSLVAAHPPIRRHPSWGHTLVTTLVTMTTRVTARVTSLRRHPSWGASRRDSTPEAVPGGGPPESPWTVPELDVTPAGRDSLQLRVSLRLPTGVK